MGVFLPNPVVVDMGQGGLPQQILVPFSSDSTLLSVRRCFLLSWRTGMTMHRRLPCAHCAHGCRNQPCRLPGTHMPSKYWPRLCHHCRSSFCEPSSLSAGLRVRPVREGWRHCLRGPRPRHQVQHRSQHREYPLHHRQTPSWRSNNRLRHPHLSAPVLPMPLRCLRNRRVVLPMPLLQAACPVGALALVP